VYATIGKKGERTQSKRKMRKGKKKKKRGDWSQKGQSILDCQELISIRKKAVVSTSPSTREGRKEERGVVYTRNKYEKKNGQTEPKFFRLRERAIRKKRGAPGPVFYILITQ